MTQKIEQGYVNAYGKVLTQVDADWYNKCCHNADKARREAGKPYTNKEAYWRTQAFKVMAARPGS